jgi:hypothetical protein
MPRSDIASDVVVHRAEDRQGLPPALGRKRQVAQDVLQLPTASVPPHPAEVIQARAQLQMTARRKGGARRVAKLPPSKHIHVGTSIDDVVSGEPVRLKGFRGPPT